MTVAGIRDGAVAPFLKLDTLSAAGAVVHSGVIKAALKDNGSYSDAAISPERMDAAKRYAVQHDPLFIPAFQRPGEPDTVHVHAYALSWKNEDGETQCIGFRVPTSSESGREAKDLVAKTKPMMAVEGAMLEQNERGMWEKRITAERPFVEWLKDKGVEVPKGPFLVTPEMVSTLQSKGYEFCLCSTGIDDLIPEGIRKIGGERHLAGDLLVRGIQGEYVRLEELNKTIEDFIEKRCAAFYSVLEGKPEVLEDAKNHPKVLDGSMSVEEAKIQVLDQAVGIMEHKLRLELNSSEVKLLLATHRYAGALESLPSLPPDPYQAILPKQITAELRELGWNEGSEEGRRFGQGIDSLIQKAHQNHGKKYDHLASTSRHVMVMRDAMDEIQALCEGGDKAKAVIAAYPENSRLKAGGFGSLNCLGDENKKALEDKWNLGIDPIRAAGAEVDNAMDQVVANAITRLVVADPARFDLPSRFKNVSQIQDRIGVAMGALVDKYADRVVPGKYGRKEIVPGEPKPADIAEMDDLVGKILSRGNEGRGGYNHPEILKALSGDDPEGSPVYKVAVMQARDSFRVVSEIANWQNAQHKKTEDILRLPKALGTLSRGGKEDPLSPAYPAYLTYPVTPTGTDIIVPLKGQETGKRYVMMEAVRKPNGLYSLQRSEELSEAKIGAAVCHSNEVNRRITAIRVPMAADFSPAQVLDEIRAVRLGENSFIYTINCQDSARLLGRMGVQLEGTFLAAISDDGGMKPFTTGAQYKAPMTYLTTRGMGDKKFKYFAVSEDGVKDLDQFLTAGIKAAGFRPAEAQRANLMKERIVAHFFSNVQAYQQGAHGLACLLPGGQGAQKPDLLGTVVYHSEEDRKRKVKQDGVAALNSLIAIRAQDFGCPMECMIFEA